MRPQWWRRRQYHFSLISFCCIWHAALGIATATDDDTKRINYLGFEFEFVCTFVNQWQMSSRGIAIEWKWISESEEGKKNRRIEMLFSYFVSTNGMHYESSHHCDNCRSCFSHWLFDGFSEWRFAFFYPIRTFARRDVSIDLNWNWKTEIEKGHFQIKLLHSKSIIIFTKTKSINNVN